MNAYILYQVQGFDGEKCCGPYMPEEAIEELKDIAGYEGVYNARIVVRDAGDSSEQTQ